MLKAKDFKKFEGTSQDFLLHIDSSRGYLKKAKGRIYYEIWAEEEDNWFINIQLPSNKTSAWMTRKDFEIWLVARIDESYILLTKI